MSINQQTISAQAINHSISNTHQVYSIPASSATPNQMDYNTKNTNRRKHNPKTTTDSIHILRARAPQISALQQTDYLMIYREKYNKNNAGFNSLKDQVIGDQQTFQKDRTLAAIIKNGENYRRQLLSAQHKEERSSLTSQVLQLQLQNIEKERQDMRNQNMHYKANIAILQKQLFMLQDNMTKYKQVFGNEIIQLQNELSASKLQIQELNSINGRLQDKTNSIPIYQEKINNSATTIIAHQKQIEVLKNQIAVLSQKVSFYEMSYPSLFQNYGNLQKSHINMQKEMGKLNHYSFYLQTVINKLNEDMKIQADFQSKVISQKTAQLNKLDQQIEILKNKNKEQNYLLQSNQKIKESLQQSLQQHVVSLKNKHLQNDSLNSQVISMSKLKYQLNETNLKNNDMLKDLENKKLLIKSKDTQICKLQGELQAAHQFHLTKSNEWKKYFNQEINKNTTQYSSRIILLSEKILATEQQNNLINERLRKQEDEKIIYKSKATDLQIKLEEKEREVKNNQQLIFKLKEEVNSLNNSNIQSKSNIEKYEVKLTSAIEIHEKSSQKEAAIIQQMTTKIREIQKYLGQQRQKNRKLNSENKQYLQYINQLGQTINLSQRQMGNIKEVIYNIQDQYTFETQKNKKLTQQHNVKQQIISNFEKITQQMRVKIMKYDQSINSYIKEIQLLKIQVNKFTLSNTNNQVALKDKEDLIKQQKSLLFQFQRYFNDQKYQIDELSKKKQNLQQNSTKLHQQNVSLAKVIDHKVIESQNLKIKIVEVEQELKQQFTSYLEETSKNYEQKIAKLSSHKQSLILELTRLQAQITQLKKAKIQLQTSLSAQKQLNQQVNAKNYDLEKIIAEKIISIHQYQNANKILTSVKDQKSEYIEKLTYERDQIATLLQQKIKQNEAVKRSMIALQNDLKNNFDVVFQKQSNKYKKQVQIINKQKEWLKQSVEEGTNHKIKAEKLKDKADNLEQIIKSTELQLQKEKQIAVKLASEVENLHKDILSQQIQMKSKYDSEISLKVKFYEEEITKWTKQILIYKENVEHLRKILKQRQTRIMFITQDNQKLHQIIINNTKSFKAEIQFLRKINHQGQIANQNLLVQLKNDNSKHEQVVASLRTIQSRCSSQDDWLRHLHNQFSQIQRLTKQLKNQRQLLVKSYILITNQVNRSSDNQLTLNRQLDGFTQFFSRVSMIHNQLNKHFSAIHSLFSNVQTINSSSLNWERKGSQLMKSLDM